MSRRFDTSPRYDSPTSALAAPGRVSPVEAAIAATRTWLVNQQHAEGYWCGELEGDSILESEYILLLAWLGREKCEAAQRAANYLVESQRPDGGWAMYPGGPLEISGSVKAYFALKLTGHDVYAEHMTRARAAILAHGGADRVNSFTRFYLALLGQIPYRLCPAVPPEMVLLPTWMPANLYRISAWSRTIFVPLSIMWSHQPVRIPLLSKEGLGEVSGIGSNGQFANIAEPPLTPPETGGEPISVPLLSKEGLGEDSGIGSNGLFAIIKEPPLTPPGTGGEPGCDIRELFVQTPELWPPLGGGGRISNPSRKHATKKVTDGLEIRPTFTWQRTFRWLDRALKLAEHWRIRPLRRRALRVAEKWMLDHFADSDGLGAIFPPIIWSVIALRCLGYAEESPEVQSCLSQLEKLAIDEGDSRRLQPCLSPVWDTAITLRSLAAAGVKPEHSAVRRGIEWLLTKEVRTRGDWTKTVRAEPGGWFFEHRNAHYPDVDDTAMAILALAEQLDIAERDGSLAGSFRAQSQAAVHAADLTTRALGATQRGVAWLLAMQNRDGGWGAFDRDNDAEFLCHVPLADHNAMIDPSTPDLTARVLEALGRLGYRATHPAVAGGIAYLRRTQESDGAWYGRWGVNYIYGTWQSLVGLAAVGVRSDDLMMRRAAAWLERYQQPNGAWGESAVTYDHPELRGEGPATASQTAWAILGLIAAGRGQSTSVERGVEWLLSTQLADGTWREDEFTGTGFPRVFYLKYHYYRVYFPLLALAARRNDKYQNDK